MEEDWQRNIHASETELINLDSGVVIRENTMNKRAKFGEKRQTAGVIDDKRT